MQVFSIGGGTMLEVVFSDSEKGSMKVAKIIKQNYVVELSFIL